MTISAVANVTLNSNLCEMLCAIARQPTRLGTLEIAAFAKNINDWDALLSLADEHRVLPLLFSRLCGLEQLVPESPRKSLKKGYDRNAFQSFANAAELISVLETFDHEKIPAIPFKGVALGASVYRNLTIRPAGDLDILIRFADLLRATAILLGRGYELKTDVLANGLPAYPHCYEYHFERPEDGMVVELRWRLELFPTRFRSDLGLGWAWPGRRTVNLAGAQVPAMSPENNLLMLCMHGSKHCWSRLIWICDVAQLLFAEPALNWSEILRDAKRFGLHRALSLGILLAQRVSGAPVPAAVLKHFESDAVTRNLAQHIQENLFVAPGSTPRGAVPYNLQMLGFRDRVRLLLSLDLFRPNERDERLLRLPKSLQSLYYLIRPFRVLWDRSAR